MATATLSEPVVAETEVRDPWLPMIVIAMGQMLMSFNVAAIPVSMGGMVESFNTPPTTVGTAVILYSLGVSGFIMLGRSSASASARRSFSRRRWPSFCWRW